MKALRRRKQGHVWWRAGKGVRKSLHEISSRNLGSLVNPVNADERKKGEGASKELVLPGSNSKKTDILKRVDKRMFRKQPRNWCWRIKTKQKMMTENSLIPQAQGKLLHRQQS